MADKSSWKTAFEEARSQALNVDAYTFQIAWAYAAEDVSKWEACLHRQIAYLLSKLEARDKND